MPSNQHRIKSHLWAWLVLLVISFSWLFLVNKTVPEPYLDEFFHVQQAQLYLQGRWNAWHPKITTPPGLYLLSYVQVSLGIFFIWSGNVTVTWLRYLNFDLGAVLLPINLLTTVVLIADRYDGQTYITPMSEKVNIGWSRGMFSQTALNICLFPPLFFFFGLYYTDVASVLSIIIAYYHFLRGSTKRFVLVGLVSLSLRQTNIFWVSAYMGGIAVLGALPSGSRGAEYPEEPTISDIVTGSWQYGCCFPPLASEADLKEYLMSGISLAIAVPLNLSTVFRALRPHLFLLAVFGAFVMWNGGVVLGDKENHTASFHLAQMLYIWPYFTFFSFPFLYPYILNLFTPSISLLPAAIQLPRAKKRAPRLLTALPILCLMYAIVHNNTLIHPFTLADNRHYMFYIFRLLLAHPSFKYLGIPIYFFTAWAVLQAFTAGPTKRKLTPEEQRMHKATMSSFRSKYLDRPPLHRGNSAPFVLVWLLATAMSLITAPLVEPRYFIVPWLLWRMHIMAPAAGAAEEKRRTVELAMETTWFLMLDAWTAYMFLYRGFEWAQEPGKVQRFMW